jgi:hypothetical protein
MDSSDQAPLSEPEDSSAPNADSADDSSVSEDDINEALAAVRAVFPPESTPLADLRLDSFDDDRAFLTAVFNGAHELEYDHGPIDACIVEQFETYGIDLFPCVSVRPLVTCLADPFVSDDDAPDSDDAPPSGDVPPSSDDSGGGS